jgi:uncharacterized protein YpbB
MGMLYIENIILYSLKQINGERTIYSIYHLLNGKKSSQTIQDAHLFSLKMYFRVADSLTREDFDRYIQNLCHQELIYKDGEGRFLLTEKGYRVISGNMPLVFLNGWEYHGITKMFWERLSLFVQVVSNISFYESHYIPIQKNKDTHDWLKSILKEIPVSRVELGASLYSEITTCIDKEHGIVQTALINRLTGFQQIGLTALQTAKKLNMDFQDYELEFINVLHYMLYKILNNRDGYQLLSLLLIDNTQNDSLTLTAKKTLQLLDQGYSKEQVSSIRNLKLSTIEDHLVELALNVSSFSIDSYVEPEIQEQIIKYSRSSSTKQLKVIRNEFKDVSYFQIRLVLAKYGDENGIRTTAK